MNPTSLSELRVHLLDAIRALAQHKPYFTNKVSEVVFARLLRRGRDREPAGGAVREIDQPGSGDRAPAGAGGWEPGGWPGGWA